MFDSEYSAEDYKSPKINIGEIMRTLKILKFIPDHLKTKIMCKRAAKKLPFVIRYVPDQYKSQQMCAKAILENG